jgi:hypothetical protein
LTRNALPFSALSWGAPTITYKPVRACFADIFNVRPEMFAAADSASWPVLESLVRDRAMSDDEQKANLLVAKGLYVFAQPAARPSSS